MHFAPGNLYHVYNQGNNHDRLFRNYSDYITFLSLYKRLIHPTIDTLAWTLMPNHFHFMLQTDHRCLDTVQQGNILLNVVSNGFRKLQSGYARIYNSRTGRSGSAFRQKTKAKCLSDLKLQPGEDIRNYFVNCFHYIHQNPLASGLVTRMEDWEYSSFKDYAGLRNGSLCNKELATLHCGYDVDNFIVQSYEIIDKKISGKFKL